MGGSLGQEREFLYVQCLMALGKRELARERARAFASRNPKTPLARRLLLLVGAE